jgi:signal transduction histidine kinase
MLRDAAGRHDIVIRTDLDATLPTTTADRVQLQQVLMNLVLNGIEAMQEPSGELKVASQRAEDGQLLISVSDSGIGFLGESPERIFEAFFTTKPRGTGMGLSISRRIIESHGGRLWASPNTGLGATFQFTLPNDAS